jgi:hypothetical protein
MTLLDAPAEKPTKSRAMAFTISAVAIIAIVALWYTFRFYPEKKAAQHLFDALVTGDTAKAYELWKPSTSYAMKDFVADWGPQGYYGPIKSFNILKVSPAPGSPLSLFYDTVAVEVALSPFAPLPDAGDAEKSSKTRVIVLWVQRKDGSISFPSP